MFDPLTVAFEIKYPWKGKGRLYRDAIITVWHKDPCSDGSDDSCDWWGHKKTTPQIRALGEAISRLETILDNRPFYPEHEAHLRFQPVKEAYRDMRLGLGRNSTAGRLSVAVSASAVSLGTSR